MFNQSDIIVLGQPKALLPILCVRIREVVAPIPPYGWLLITEEGNWIVAKQESELCVTTTFVVDVQSLNALLWYGKAIESYPELRSWGPKRQALVYKRHLELQPYFVNPDIVYMGGGHSNG